MGKLINLKGAAGAPGVNPSIIGAVTDGSGALLFYRAIVLGADLNPGDTTVTGADYGSFGGWAIMTGSQSVQIIPPGADLAFLCGATEDAGDSSNTATLTLPWPYALVPAGSTIWAIFRSTDILYQALNLLATKADVYTEMSEGTITTQPARNAMTFVLDSAPWYDPLPGMAVRSQHNVFSPPGGIDSAAYEALIGIVASYDSGTLTVTLAAPGWNGDLTGVSPFIISFGWLAVTAADLAALAAVAKSGSYTDLADKPTIPAAFDPLTMTIRTGSTTPTGAPTGTELPIAIKDDTVQKWFYYWTGAAWIQGPHSV